MNLTTWLGIYNAQLWDCLGVIAKNFIPRDIKLDTHHIFSIEVDVTCS